MDIITYFFFSYGLTAVIGFFTVGLILVTNKIMRVMEGSGKNSQASQNM